ncbi:hypothetical protein HMPREF9318_02105 [Streptococcus urinalis FB127-CNA-2]|nr:hypothetical protein HMPREF9318_02105 [Streptococcus urinalis FB127-CNA-2]VEF32522.1 membrane protein [Streptococcus urinalis]
MDESKTSIFLGLLRLSIITVLVYLSFEWFLKLLSILNTYNSIIIVAIITGFVTILTTSFKVIFDIKQVWLQYLTQKRESAYFHFIKMIF